MKVEDDAPPIDGENWPESIMQMVRAGGPEAIGALEITLMQFALAALHNYRDELHDIGMKAVEEDRTKQKKLARAVTKAAFRTRNYDTALKIFSKDDLWTRVAERLGRRNDDGFTGDQGFGRRKGMQWVPEHERGGHTVRGYWRRRKAGEQVSSATEEKLAEERRSVNREVESQRRAHERRREGDRGLERIGESAIEAATDTERFRRPFSLENVSGTAEKLLSARESEIYNQAIKEGIDAKDKGWLAGVGAVGNVLTKDTGRIQFIFKAMKEFGPFTGARIAYNYFRRGGYDLPMQVVGGKILTETGDEIPPPGSQVESRNWAMRVLKGRLPGQQAENSKAEPPSEGFIIDRNGNILAHAVGRGNDYFLPFSSRHLRRIRNEDGVEIVRRRMYGGPTMEDFHAAMMLGVDRFTVISNTGEFTVELTSRAHGFKLEHVQVLERFRDIVSTKKEMNFTAYESLLEALESEFPLHMKLKRSDPGEWSERHDRIQPPKGFWSGLSEIFGVLSGDDLDRIPKEKRKREDYLPNIMAGESVSDWYFKQKRRNEDPIKMLDRVFRFQREHVGSSRPEEIGWIKNEIQKLSKNPDLAQRLADQTDIHVPGATRRDHVSSSEYNRPGFNPESVTGSINWDQYPNAAFVLSQMGFSLDSYKNAPRVRRMAQQIQSLPQELIDELIEGRRTTDIRTKRIEDEIFDEFSFS